MLRKKYMGVEMMIGRIMITIIILPARVKMYGARNITKSELRLLVELEKPCKTNSVVSVVLALH